MGYGGDVMREEEVQMTIEEMQLFDAPKRIREALQGLEKEFKDYKMGEVTIGVEVGFPAVVKGTLSATFTKDNKG